MTIASYPSEWQTLAAQLWEGDSIPPAALTNALMRRSRVERFYLCWAMADQLKQRKIASESRRFMDRAFGLWENEPEFIESYLDLLRGEKDAENIRRVSKAAGMHALERGRLIEGLEYFNIHQYAYQSLGLGDHYEYDQDILRAVSRIPRPGSVSHCTSLNVAKPRLRIAYIVYGALHTSSVLIRIMEDFARHHDPEKFECRFFSPDVNRKTRGINAELIRSAGGEFVAIDSLDDEYCLLESERLLHDFSPDVLVSVAALADYRQYYLFSGVLAPVKIALCFGPPAQYVPPEADFVISATWHPLLDSPCDGTVVKFEASLPEHPKIIEDLINYAAISDAAVLLIMAGRSEKFLDRDYWEVMIDVLRTCEQACLIVVGLTKLPEFFKDLYIEDIKARLIVKGWTENYLQILAAADVVIDTYPSGGGLIMLDCMALGIPMLSFRNDFSKTYTQLSWSLADEVLGIEELIFERGDFAHFKNRLVQLIQQADLRERLGQACQEKITRERGMPSRMVTEIERVYGDVYRQHAV